MITLKNKAYHYIQFIVTSNSKDFNTLQIWSLTVNKAAFKAEWIKQNELQAETISTEANKAEVINIEVVKFKAFLPKK